MARLVLGPILRYVGETEATVWVETDEPCTVAVLGSSTPTFRIKHHNYALVYVEGLTPGTTTPYEVNLDGETVWPDPNTDLPPSVIKTPCKDDPVKVIWGSCRVALPHHKPFTLRKDQDKEGRENDAVYAYAKRMIESPHEDWPHLMLWLGDQVYADELSPKTDDFIRSRRDPSKPPGLEVADFDEYRFLYHHAWGDSEVIRWLLSTVSSAMIFDDHDVHDDWNTSRAWVDMMREKPWWHERIVSAFMTYWLYQHLGNLSPRDLAEDEIYKRVKDADDGEHILREAAERWDAHTDGSRWSYCRDLANTRIVMMDSRAGRVLDGTREMVDQDEWRYIADHASGDFDHLVLATSLPFLLPPGLHWLEAWDEAVAGGAWGERWAKRGEKYRQKYDLEHWAAFEDTFHRVVELVREVGAGERGEPPETILFLSGDVHNAYTAEARFPDEDGVRSRVYQGVCSPFRNPLDRHERLAMRLASTRAFERITEPLARRAGVKPPRMSWQLDQRPIFDNQIATLDWHGREMTMSVERTLPGDADHPRLEVSCERRLA